MEKKLIVFDLDETLRKLELMKGLFLKSDQIIYIECKILMKKMNNISILGGILVMKIITVEEHFMVKEINDRFNRVIKPKDDFDFVLKTFDREHILWAQDYPYGINDINVKTFLEEYNIDDETREMIAHKNAEKLFKIQVRIWI